MTDLELDLARSIIVSAGEKWLLQTKTLPELGPVGHPTADLCAAVAAWLDFIDDLWPALSLITGTPLPKKRGNDRELQSEVRQWA